jgi:hypothetical protein
VAFYLNIQSTTRDSLANSTGIYDAKLSRFPESLDTACLPNHICSGPTGPFQYNKRHLTTPKHDRSLMQNLETKPPGSGLRGHGSTWWSSSLMAQNVSSVLRGASTEVKITVPQYRPQTVQFMLEAYPECALIPFTNAQAGASQMKECITTEYFLVPTINPLFIKSTASQTKSLMNSAALVGFSLPQNLLTTTGSL